MQNKLVDQDKGSAAKRVGDDGQCHFQLGGERCCEDAHVDSTNLTGRKAVVATRNETMGTTASKNVAARWIVQRFMVSDSILCSDGRGSGSVACRDMQHCFERPCRRTYQCYPVVQGLLRQDKFQSLCERGEMIFADTRYQCRGGTTMYSGV